MRLRTAPDSRTISFVSYFSFVSKRLESQRFHSYLVAPKYYDPKFDFL